MYKGKGTQSTSGGWFGQSYRHSLAARGISTSNASTRTTSRNTYMKGKMMKFLMDDGRAQTPDYAAEMRLQTVEMEREKALDALREAEEKGNVSYKQAEEFFERDFKDEVKDFLDNKRTADQFRAGVQMKLKRVTQPVKVMGVADE